MSLAGASFERTYTVCTHAHTLCHTHGHGVHTLRRRHRHRHSHSHSHRHRQRRAARASSQRRAALPLTCADADEQEEPRHNVSGMLRTHVHTRPPSARVSTASSTVVVLQRQTNVLVYKVTGE
eukprot:2890079-Rhodomonas_salina.1